MPFMSARFIIKKKRGPGGKELSNHDFLFNIDMPGGWIGFTFCDQTFLLPCPAFEAFFITLEVNASRRV